MRPVGKNARPYQKKITKAKRLSMAQVTGCLPGKCKILSSNPSTSKKTIWAWWHTPAIPAMQGTEKGGS
jgi:hypothetical protein